MSDPSATLPLVGTAELFAEEEREYCLAERARRDVDALVSEAIKKGDARARSEGIRGLKAFLGTPDELDRTLEVFCYGWTAALRLQAGAALLKWMKAEHGDEPEFDLREESGMVVR